MMVDIVRKIEYTNLQLKYVKCKHPYSLLEDERGADDMELITSLLKQSSCLGNHDASFMLSVILNYGVAVKSVEVEVSLKSWGKLSLRGS